MSGELDTILRLVADGHLTPEEAAPIIEALTAAGTAARGEGQPPPSPGSPWATTGIGDVDRPTGGRHLRVRVTERGRQVVNLRIPIGFVDAALDIVPGLGDHGDRIRQAVSSGATGPILDVEEPGGDGVLISVE